MASLASLMAIGLLEAISRAIDMASSMSFSGGTTLSTTPSCFSSSALTGVPQNIMRRTLEWPNRRMERLAPPSRPTLISGSLISASVEATRMSQDEAMPMPAPSAGPLMAAITGFLHSIIE